MKKKTTFLSLFFLISIITVSLKAYLPMLSNFFTGVDSFTLIKTSRIESKEDALKIFFEPLMSGTRFSEKSLYFRPISNLTYSLDYAIWKLNPFGYHLTDLLLHILTSIVVYGFVFSISKRKIYLSWMSALIFSMHPILIETVPAISRRQDILASLFFFFLFGHFGNTSKILKKNLFWPSPCFSLYWPSCLRKSQR